MADFRGFWLFGCRELACVAVASPPGLGLACGSGAVPLPLPDPSPLLNPLLPVASPAAGSSLAAWRIS